ncbi:MAG: class I SAM-dependent methyltransferase [Anaerolineaceae bacterium]|nr:class I SAM-dependent methyltransferase [Anaerolineaceae bacterium]
MKPIKYTIEPADTKKFTAQFDRFYSLFSGVYTILLKLFPIWNKWIRTVLPHIQGPRVLEISFGTGYLLTQYANQYDTYAIDYNATFVFNAKKNMENKGIPVNIQQANVENMPYAENTFDSIINTMAFTGYPNAEKALSEMKRILKPGGKLIIVDIDYPENKNRIGVFLTKFWILMGDLVRNMQPLFDKMDFEVIDKEIGGWGSVHLYLVQKK